MSLKVYDIVCNNQGKTPILEGRKVPLPPSLSLSLDTIIINAGYGLKNPTCPGASDTSPLMSVSSPGGEGCLVSMAKVVDARLASSGAMISNVAVLASSTCSPTCVGQRKQIVVEGVFKIFIYLFLVLIT